MIQQKFRTKHLSDEWMVARGFMEPPVSAKDPWWVRQPISDIREYKKIEYNTFTDAQLSCTNALALMKAKSIDSLFYFRDNVLKNVVTKKNIMSKLVNGSLNSSDPALGASLDRTIFVFFFLFVFF